MPWRAQSIQSRVQRISIWLDGAQVPEYQAANRHAGTSRSVTVHRRTAEVPRPSRAMQSTRRLVGADRGLPRKRFVPPEGLVAPFLISPGGTTALRACRQGDGPLRRAPSVSLPQAPAQNQEPLPRPGTAAFSVLGYPPRRRKHASGKEHSLQSSVSSLAPLAQQMPAHLFAQRHALELQRYPSIERCYEEAQAFLSAASSDHPYRLDLAQEENLLSAVARCMQSTTAAASHAGVTHFYRITSLAALLKYGGRVDPRPVSLVFNDLQRDWVPLSRFTRSVPARRGVVWWGSTCPPRGRLLEAAHSRGLATNWVSSQSVVLRIAAERLAEKGPILVPGPMEGILQPIFCVVKQGASSGCSIDISEPSDLRFGDDEYLTDAIASNAVDVLGYSVSKGPRDPRWLDGESDLLWKSLARFITSELD